MRGIEVKNVSKTYKDTKALSNINIYLEENKIYGLLGRNGAGKTTLLNVINNRVYADEGTVTLNGDILTENDEALNHLYFTSEKLLFPEGMKVKKIFRWTKEFHPEFDMDYALRIAKLFGLPLNKKSSTLSTGYKSILKNVIALSINTPYIFLDEPVLGLDANHRELFYKLLIEKYSENPFTIVISTHLIEEVSNIIEDVIIIKNGKIIEKGSCEDLLKRGYAISGTAASVDNYIRNNMINGKVIGEDSIGNLKSVYILGRPKETLPENLEVSALDLQKLFIQLTNV